MPRCSSGYRERPLPASRGLSRSDFVLYTQDDALNFARDCVERGNRWLSSKHLDVAEEYVKGAHHLVIQLRSLPDAEKLGLAVVRMPSVVSELGGADDFGLVNGQRISHGGSAKWDKNSMGLYIPSLVETPEGLVAVW